jgi:hypothetical protein
MSEASDRLARTRLAIIEHVYRKEIRRDKQAFAADRQQAEESQPHEAAADLRRGRGRMGRVRRAARNYWRHHPARMGVQMATPLLSKYARHHPLAFLGIAAAAGAVLMAARPWRLISVTGVLVAIAKSPQLAGLIMSAMSGTELDDEDES